MKTKLTLFTLMIITLTCLFQLYLKIVISDPNIPIELKSIHESSWNLMNNYTDEHLFWFVQISDLHISEFRDPSRIEELKTFLNRELRYIQPRVVLVSGDITDGKTPNHVGSKQYEFEWKTYNTIVKEYNSNEKIAWLDIRGNHDNFDVPSIDSSQNLFKKYGFTGSKYSRSYMIEVNDGNDRYSFIAVDASLDPGPRRPFNFFGYLSKTDIEQLEYYNQLASKSNGTIWFGHYPTSTISSGKHITDIMTNGIAYLCGHLHTLLGVSRMYTRHSNGLLELELSDWKNKRKFRIGAFDTGLFTISDYKLSENGIYILVTNPKHFVFKTSREKEIQSLKYSTHIRILVFSGQKIDKVSVYLDDKYLGEAYRANKTKETPLYLLEWKPFDYLDGIHTLKVEAIDSRGIKELSEIEFTLNDLTTFKFGVISTWILKTEMIKFMRNVFIVELLLFILFLSFFRYYNRRISMSCVRYEKLRAPILRFVRQMILVSSLNSTYWFLVLSPIYILFGPWFVGEIMQHFYGICFAWGIYVKGTLLESDVQYLYACFYIIQFYIPLTLHLGYIIYKRHIDLKKINSDTISKNFTFTILNFLWINLYFAILLAFFLYFTYESFNTYSFTSVIINPMRTWMFIIAIILHFKCNNLENSSIDRIIDSRETIKFSSISTTSNANNIVEENDNDKHE